jgi:transposase
LTTKIHAVVDAVGLPVRLLLTPGQASDKTTLPSLIEGLRPAREAIADRGYSARSIIELFAARGTTAHIPSQSNVRVVRSVDLERYRRRNLIERFFNKIKHLQDKASAPDRYALRQARQKFPGRRRPCRDPHPHQTL